MRRVIAIVIFTLIFAMLSNCGRKPTFEAARILFEEIIEADDPFSADILQNHWLAIEVLAGANKSKPQPEKVKSIYNTFIRRVSNFDEAEYTNRILEIFHEYAANLLLATPENGILMTSSDQIWSLAFFQQQVFGIRRDVLVFSTNFAFYPRYRKYLKKKGFELPDSIFYNQAGVAFPKETAANEAAEWAMTSAGRAVFSTLDIPVLVPEGGYLCGQGRLFNFPLSDDSLKSRILRLHSETFFFDAAGDSTLAKPILAEAVVQTYFESNAFNMSNWIREGDTTTVDSLLRTLNRRLPSDWQSAYAYLRLHPELPEIERNGYIARIVRYSRLYPHSSRARDVLKILLPPSEEGVK